MTAPVADVLLVQDAPLAADLVRILARAGYAVWVVHTPADAEKALRSARPDLVLLDLGLPDQDGIAVCHQARRRPSPPGVLVITGRASETETVVALDAGADDVLIRPFRSEVLLARLAALHRRIQRLAQRSARPVCTKHVVVDPGTQQCWVDGLPVPLTGAKLQILAALLRAPGKVVEPASVANELGISPPSVKAHMPAIRAAIAPYDGHIVTVRGFGYRYDPGPVASLTAQPGPEPIGGTPKRGW